MHDDGYFDEKVAMSKPGFPIRGSCLCGRVKLEIGAPPVITMICHCVDCQKMTSSAYSLGAKIPSDSFAVTEGEPVIGGLRTARKHYFCPRCMSLLFTRLEGQDNFVNVRTPMFEDLKSFAPFIELFTSEKLPWVATTAAHSYDKFPSREELGDLVDEYAGWAGQTA